MRPGHGTCTRVSVQAADLLSEVSSHKRTHGAVWRQGTLILPCSGQHRLAGRTLCSDAMIIHMTLGNGYLGSRIDEERSKMRYLV